MPAKSGGRSGFLSESAADRWLQNEIAVTVDNSAVFRADVLQRLGRQGLHEPEIDTGFHRSLEPRPHAVRSSAACGQIREA